MMTSTQHPLFRFIGLGRASLAQSSPGRKYAGISTPTLSNNDRTLSDLNRNIRLRIEVFIRAGLLAIIYMRRLWQQRNRPVRPDIADRTYSFPALSISRITWYKPEVTFKEEGKGNVTIRNMGADLNEGRNHREMTELESSKHADVSVSQYWGEVCGYIRSRFGSGPPDPEEVVQTAFVKILSRQDVATLENPRAFLYTTAYNTAIDMIRSQNRQRQNRMMNDGENVNVNTNTITPERVLLSKEDFRFALDTIKNMSELERETLILYRIHGLTLVDIAARLGKSKTSIIRYLASATQSLLEAARTFDDVKPVPDEGEDS